MDLVRVRHVVFIVHLGNVNGARHWITAHANVVNRQVRTFDSMGFDNTPVGQVCDVPHIILCTRDTVAQAIANFLSRQVDLAIAAWCERTLDALPSWLRYPNEWIVDGNGICGRQLDDTECGAFALASADDIAHGREPTVCPESVVGRRARFAALLLQ